MVKINLKLKKGKEYDIQDIINKIIKKEKDEIIVSIEKYNIDWDEPHESRERTETILIAKKVKDVIKIIKILRKQSEIKELVYCNDKFDKNEKIYECIKKKKNALIYKIKIQDNSGNSQYVVKINNLSKKDKNKIIKKMNLKIKIYGVYTKEKYKLNLDKKVIMEIEPNYDKNKDYPTL